MMDRKINPEVRSSLKEALTVRPAVVKIQEEILSVRFFAKHKEVQCCSRTGL